MFMAALESSAPTLLTAPVFVILAIYVSAVLGRRVLLLLGARSGALPSEQFVVGVAIGLGLLQFAPFVLGALGILSITSVRIVLAIILAITLVDLPRIVAAAARWWRGRRRLAAWEWVFLALVTIPLAYPLFQALAPSFDPDGIGYHIAAPKRWLDIGSLAFLPTFTYTNGPMGTEMLFLSSLSVVGDVGSKSLHFTASIVAAGGIYLAGSRIGRLTGAPLVGHIAVVLWLFSPVGIYSVMGASYSEGTSTMAIVAGALCWLLWFDSRDRSWLAPTALLSGIAVTFKLTAVVFPVALLVLTVLIVRSRGRRETGMAGLTGRSTVGLLALVVAPVLPWMIRSVIVVRNPVFPIFAQWIPSRNFPAESSRNFETWNRYMIWGNTRGYDLSLDARKAILVSVALIVLVVGTFVWWRLSDPISRIVAGVLTGTIIVQLYAAGLYFRYWTPLFAVLQLPILAFVLARVQLRTARACALGLALLFSVTEVRSALQDRPMDLVLSSVDQDERDQERVDRFGLLPLYEAANQLTVGDEAVLTGYGCAGFYVDGPVLCAETLETSLRLTDWDDFNSDLEKFNVSYLIAPTGLATGTRPPGGGARAVGDIVRDDEFAMLSRLIQERGELIATALDQSLYRIAPPPS